jgi:hypothetical protein
MAETVSVNSVQPSEISREMVAYLLTVSVLAGPECGKGWAPASGTPILHGFDKDAVLSTYAECLRTVRQAHTDSERKERASRSTTW